jgi:hypothetical protein
MLLGAGALLFGASLFLSEAFDPDSPGSHYFREGAALVGLAAFAAALGVWSLERRVSAVREESAADKRPSRGVVLIGAAMLVIAGALLVIAAGAVRIAIDPDVIETNLSLAERLGTATVLVALMAVPLVAGLWLLRGR